MITVTCPECKTAYNVQNSGLGKKVECKNCGEEFLIEGKGSLRPLSGTVVAVGAGFVLVMILVGLFLGARAMGVVFLMVIGLVLTLWVYALLAKAYAVSSKRKELQVFPRLAHLVLWDPTEGVLFLKNKEVEFVDDLVDDGGGIRWISPIRGQEIALRVPLTVLTTEVRDKQVYTRDSLPLDIKLTVWWKVRDLRKFYLSVGREVHEADVEWKHKVHRAPPIQNGDDRFDKASHEKLGVAENWIRVSIEGQLRTLVATISTSLLVADDVAKQLGVDSTGKLPSPRDAETQEQLATSEPRDVQPEQALGTYQQVPDTLFETLSPKLNATLKDHGVELVKVVFQEVALPPEIHQKAIDAAKAWCGIIEARREGVGEAAKVQELVKVLGREAVGAAEVLKHYKGTTVSVGISGVLDTLFAGLSKTKP